MRNSYARRPVAFGQCPFEGRAVIHFRPPGETALGDEASDGALLLAAERRQRPAACAPGPRCRSGELALSAHDQHVVIFEQQRGPEAARRIREDADRNVDATKVDLLGEVDPCHRLDQVDRRRLKPEYLQER